jgi:hypothetical protein
MQLLLVTKSNIPKKNAGSSASNFFSSVTKNVSGFTIISSPLVTEFSKQEKNVP